MQVERQGTSTHANSSNVRHLVVSAVGLASVGAASRKHVAVDERGREALRNRHRVFVHGIMKLLDGEHGMISLRHSSDDNTMTPNRLNAAHTR